MEKLYASESTILAVQQKYLAVNKMIESVEDVIKAGTLVNMTGVNEPVEVVTSADEVAGIVLYDVPVKDGKASVPVLLKGVVNIDKLTPQPSKEIQDALKDIQFISRGKGAQ